METRKKEGGELNSFNRSPEFGAQRPTRRREELLIWEMKWAGLLEVKLVEFLFVSLE